MILRMNADTADNGRLIRHIRHYREPNHCRIEIEELYEANEPFDYREGDRLVQEVSVVRTWRWRTVFIGDGSDYEVALTEWLQRMNRHPDLGHYRALFEANSAGR